MKFALAVLVLGVVAYGVYSFSSKPDYDAVFDERQGTIHAKISSSDIYPKTAYVNNSLSIKMVNATRDEYAYLDVRWFRNGSEIPNVAGPTLDAKHTRKGDKVHAEVNLLGPDAVENPVITRPVEILNSPPRITSASTALRTMDTDVLYARVEAYDADGDNLKYTYRWFRNGSPIEGADKPTLPVADFAQNDDLHAEVVAFDGEDESAWVKCDPIKLGSNAPVIKSQPPSAFTPDRRYVYQIEMENPNALGLAYELVRAPDGMTVSSTGMVDWELPEPQAGSRQFDVTIRVVDATGGEAVQDFSITLSGRSNQ